MKNLEQEELISNLIDLEDSEPFKLFRALRELITMPIDVAVDDWKNYTVLEKLVFTIICSPVVWMLTLV